MTDLYNPDETAAACPEVQGATAGASGVATEGPIAVPPSSELIFLAADTAPANTPAYLAIVPPTEPDGGLMLNGPLGSSDVYDSKYNPPSFITPVTYYPRVLLAMNYAQLASFVPKQTGVYRIEIPVQMELATWVDGTSYRFSIAGGVGDGTNYGISDMTNMLVLSGAPCCQTVTMVTAQLVAGQNYVISMSFGTGTLPTAAGSCYANVLVTLLAESPAPTLVAPSGPASPTSARVAAAVAALSKGAAGYTQARKAATAVLART